MTGISQLQRCYGNSVAKHSILNSAMLQMNYARGHMTVEAQWRGRAMKMELTGMYGVCPH